MSTRAQHRANEAIADGVITAPGNIVAEAVGIIGTPESAMSRRPRTAAYRRRSTSRVLFRSPKSSKSIPAAAAALLSAAADREAPEGGEPCGRRGKHGQARRHQRAAGRLGGEASARNRNNVASKERNPLKCMASWRLFQSSMARA